ncbi:Kin of IRRE-like protein 3 [Halotydeus destructor]|nr:Kin of IRRE-like protein 3 [Halotydeus destructor]
MIFHILQKMKKPPIVWFLKRIFLCKTLLCGHICSLAMWIVDLPAYVALVGNNVALPCNITPLSPEDSVSLILWYRNDSVKPVYTVDARDVSLHKAEHLVDTGLQSRTAFHINYPTGYLHISPVHEEDGGEYRCRVDFKRGRTVNRILTLNVIVKPQQVQIIASKEIMSVGKRFEVVCQTKGSKPAAQVVWKKGNSLLDKASRETVSDDGFVTTSFFTLVPSEEDNRKPLTCLSFNPRMPQHTIEDHFTMNVAHSPVVSLVLGANINRNGIVEGSDVFFECNIQANPAEREIGWILDGQRLSEVNSHGLMVNNRTLLIKNVTRKHEDPPECRPGQKIHYGAELGDKVLVTCDLDSDPSEVVFSWSFNKSQGAKEETKFVSSGSTSLATVDLSNGANYGMLSCWGQNRIGMQTQPCTFFIIPAGLPESPENCTITNETANSVTVECLPAFDGGLEQSFHLQISLAGNAKNFIEMSTKDYPFFSVANLPSGANLLVKIFSANSKGHSSMVTLVANTVLVSKLQSEDDEELPLSPTILSAALILSAFALLTAIVCLARKSRRRTSSEQFKGRKTVSLPLVLVAEVSQDEQSREQAFADNGFESSNRQSGPSFLFDSRTESCSIVDSSNVHHHDDLASCSTASKEYTVEPMSRKFEHEVVHSTGECVTCCLDDSPLGYCVIYGADGEPIEACPTKCLCNCSSPFAQAQIATLQKETTENLFQDINLMKLNDEADIKYVQIERFDYT